MRILYVIFFLYVFGGQTYGQTIHGRVVDDRTGNPIEGASLRWFSKVNGGGHTQRDGQFELAFRGADTLIISRLGYITYRTYITSSESREFRISPSENQIQEVSVSTGYYKLPKERVTGSFGVLDSTLLNRDARPNILQRIENMVPGVQFIKSGGKNTHDIRIRGLSSINSDRSPLVVLDNFPYEGDITNIDANDIESITILKDAAASSIWGARAGNGVIVITSKQLKKQERTTLSFLTNVQWANRPDFSYNRSWLPSRTVMEIEKYRYGQGHYTFSDEVPIPMYVEWLKALDEGSVSQAEFDRQDEIFRNTDILQEAKRYLYQSPVSEQYAVSLTAGGKKNSFVVNGQFNKTRETVIGNANRQVNMNVRNRFSPSEKFEVIVGLSYSGNRASNDGISIDMLGTSQFGISPYYRLRDENGMPMPIVKDHRFTYAKSAGSLGLIDWLYKPLEDRDAVSAKGLANEMRLNVEANIQPLAGLKLSVLYQYITGNNGASTHYFKNS